MKEYAWQMVKSFHTGLRPESPSDLSGEQGLVECFNAKPARGGLEAWVDVTNPITTSNSWPFPQLLRSKKDLYLCYSNSIYKVNTDYSTTLLLSGLSAGTHWTLADFHDFQVFANGVAMCYRDPDGGLTSAYPGDGLIYSGNVVAAHRGQLFVGDTSKGDNWVEWSEIGAADMEISRLNTAGGSPMPWSGTVYNMLSLRKDLVVYGSNGISILRPVVGPEYAFGAFELVEILDYGIAARGAVVGNTQQHLFIDELGYLRMLSSKGVEELGYQEYFAPMLGNHIVLVKNDLAREIYIGDGTYSFVLTKYGLGEHSQPISGGVAQNAGFIGVGGDSTESDLTIVSDTFDLGLRARKTLYAVQVGAKTSKPIKVALDWKSDYSEDFQRTAYKVINPSKVVTMITTAVAFRLVFIVEDYASDFELSDVVVRWKLSDKSSIRGQYAT